MESIIEVVPVFKLLSGTKSFKATSNREFSNLLYASSLFQLLVEKRENQCLQSISGRKESKSYLKSLKENKKIICGVTFCMLMRILSERTQKEYNIRIVAGYYFAVYDEK